MCTVNKLGELMPLSQVSLSLLVQTLHSNSSKVSTRDYYVLNTAYSIVFRYMIRTLDTTLCTHCTSLSRTQDRICLWRPSQQHSPMLLGSTQQTDAHLLATFQGENQPGGCNYISHQQFLRNKMSDTECLQNLNLMKMDILNTHLWQISDLVDVRWRTFCYAESLTRTTISILLHSQLRPAVR